MVDNDYLEELEALKKEYRDLEDKYKEALREIKRLNIMRLTREEKTW
tara:strand:- start:50 stop:190 length:141 start_codon:yes stop_codon:yes gene_type:complete